MSVENNIRTFRDFLEFYNLMSQTCFAHCVDSFKTRQLEPHEIDCVEKCTTKLIRFNNRSISIYADVQSKLMEKRQKEMEANEQISIPENKEEIQSNLVADVVVETNNEAVLE